MKLTILRSNLLAALSRTVPLAKQKSTMPVLSCVLIRADLMQPLTVSATNLQQSVVTKTPADTSDAGACCVDARDIEARVKTFPEGPITVQLDDNHLQLTAGKRKHRIPVIDASDFPPLAPPPDSAATLPGQALATVLEQTKDGASEDVDRANLNGVFLEFLSGELRASSTDGRRVYEATQPCPGLAVSEPVLLPLPSVDGILASLDTAQSAHVGQSVAEFSVRSGDTVFMTKLAADAAFPKLADFWSSKPSNSFSLDPAALADALVSVSLGTKRGDLAGLVEFSLDSGDLLISGTGRGAASSAVPISQAPASVATFAALTHLLLPFLRGAPSPLTVSVSPTDPLSPIYLTSAHARAIVMPCRR